MAAPLLVAVEPTHAGQVRRAVRAAHRGAAPARGGLRSEPFTFCAFFFGPGTVLQCDRPAESRHRTAYWLARQTSSCTNGCSPSVILSAHEGRRYAARGDAAATPRSRDPESSDGAHSVARHTAAQLARRSSRRSPEACRQVGAPYEALNFSGALKVAHSSRPIDLLPLELSCRTCGLDQYRARNDRCTASGV